SGVLAFGAVQGILTVSANTTPITATINTAITGTGGILVNSTGDVRNVITLGGANTFTGAIVIGGGTLRLGSSAAVNGAAPNVLNLAATDAIFELNGNNVTVSDLTGVAGSVIRNST